MVCWDVEEHGCLGFHSRIKQSFYPRTRHGELKVISMIYAPPYLIIRRSEGDVDRSRTRNISDDNPGAHKTANTGKQATVHHYYYGATQDSRRHHTTRQHDIDLSSRTVTNSLSGASITHEYRTLRYNSSCLATGDQSTVISMATQAIMVWHTSMAKG